MRRHAFRVLLLELNEISWELMEPWLTQGLLPNFRRLQREGAWTRTVCDERDELLDPWVTWTTLHAGVPQAEHGVRHLEQPPETVRAKRSWEIARAAGKRVGIFGSCGSWPPFDTGAFHVPGAFSPDAQAWPPRLQPIQQLNVTYTRAHSPVAEKPGTLDAMRLGLSLMRLGLDAGTALRVARTVAEIRTRPERSWKKVSLQPILNFAFFRRLFVETKPDFATFHTNHVAHYQHRFMRARWPERYPDPTAPEEIARFGDAIEYGYRVADELLGRFLDLAARERDLILCVASSMGQKPWLPERHERVAPESCRLRSISRLLEILGLTGHCDAFSTMAPQWNLRIPSLERRLKAIRDLESARYEPLGSGMYSVREVGDTLVITPAKRHGLTDATRCSFPTVPGAPTFPIAELVVRKDETRKSGCHDPVGLLAFHGAGVRRAFCREENVHILDVLPTLLALMDVPAPVALPGRALQELFIAPLDLRTGGAAQDAHAPRSA